MNDQPFKVAAVQAAPAYLDLERGTDKAIASIEQAAKKGVRLIAFPETWLPGYPWWIWLGAPAFGGDLFTRLFENSAIAGGEYDKRISEAARENGIHVVMGLSERDGDKIYMAQWHYDAKGNVISRRRKLRPTHEERGVFGEGDKSDLVVKSTELGRIGALCCCEHLQPMLKCALASQGEQIHVAAWPGFSLYTNQAYAFGAELNLAASRIYAAETQTFVIVSCGMVSDQMLDLLCSEPSSRSLIEKGGGYARIFGPDGDTLGEVLPPDEEGLVTAKISPIAISRAKSAANPMAYYDLQDIDGLLYSSKPRQR